MSYSQALEQKVSALAAYGGPAGRQVIRAIMDEARFDEGQRSEYWGLLCRGLAAAEPYYWAPDICDLIGEAAKKIPAWTFRADRLPTRAGYFWFAKPVAIPHDGDWQGDLKAISWFGVSCGAEGDFEGYERAPGTGRVFLTGSDTPGTPGMCVYFWSDYGTDLRFSFGVPTTTYILKDGITLGDISTESGLFYQEGKDRRLSKMAVLAAALEFVAQEILVTHTERPSRSTRRRLEAHGILDEPTIQVVKMRRVARQERDHGSPAEPVEWSCQWIVRGHWRQQACGPNFSERRPVFVLPYVKGDPEKPLKASTERVFAVVR